MRCNVWVNLHSSLLQTARYLAVCSRVLISFQIILIGIPVDAPAAGSLPGTHTTLGFDGGGHLTSLAVMLLGTSTVVRQDTFTYGDGSNPDAITGTTQGPASITYGYTASHPRSSHRNRLTPLLIRRRQHHVGPEEGRGVGVLDALEGGEGCLGPGHHHNHRFVFRSMGGAGDTPILWRDFNWRLFARITHAFTDSLVRLV